MVGWSELGVFVSVVQWKRAQWAPPPPPTFYYIFVISLTCFNSVWSFIGNLSQIILLGNNLKQRWSQLKLTNSLKTFWTSFLHVCVTSCTKLQCGKRLFETFHKTLYPFKELLDVSIFFSHCSVSLSYFFLVLVNCACKVVKYKEGWFIAKYTIQLVNKPLAAAGVSKDSPQGWKIVRIMNSWPRSEASRVTEILRTIFQPRALSSDIPASRKGVYLCYNPPNNCSRRTHVDRSCICCGFFRVSRYGIVNQPFIYPSLASAKSLFWFSLTKFSENVCTFWFSFRRNKIRRSISDRTADILWYPSSDFVSRDQFYPMRARRNYSVGYN